MRHRVKAKHFNRDTKARKAMFKGLLSNLFEHGSIETTEAKAKQVKRLADKVITKAKPANLNARRVLESFFGSKQIVNRIVDSVTPVMKERTSGFTRIVRLGRRRGDDAMMVKLELVEQPLEKPAKETKEATAKTEAKAPTKSAAKKAPAKAAADKADKEEAKPAKKPAAKKTASKQADK